MSLRRPHANRSGRHHNDKVSVRWNPSSTEINERINNIIERCQTRIPDQFTLTASGEVWKELRGLHRLAVRDGQNLAPFDLWVSETLPNEEIPVSLLLGHSRYLSELDRYFSKATKRFHREPWQFLLCFDNLAQRTVKALRKVAKDNPTLTLEEICTKAEAIRASRTHEYDVVYENNTIDFECLSFIPSDIWKITAATNAATVSQDVGLQSEGTVDEGEEGTPEPDEVDFEDEETTNGLEENLNDVGENVLGFDYNSPLLGSTDLARDDNNDSGVAEENGFVESGPANNASKQDLPLVNGDLPVVESTDPPLQASPETSIDQTPSPVDVAFGGSDKEGASQIRVPSIEHAGSVGSMEEEEEAQSFHEPEDSVATVRERTSDVPPDDPECGGIGGLQAPGTCRAAYSLRHYSDSQFIRWQIKSLPAVQQEEKLMEKRYHEVVRHRKWMELCQRRGRLLINRRNKLQGQHAQILLSLDELKQRLQTVMDFQFLSSSYTGGDATSEDTQQYLKTYEKEVEEQKRLRQELSNCDSQMKKTVSELKALRYAPELS